MPPHPVSTFLFLKLSCLPPSLQLILENAPGKSLVSTVDHISGATCQPRLLDACSWEIDRSRLDLINA